MLTFYVLEDESVPGTVKVGKDTSWPNRFKQARCHSPGRILARAVFELPDMDRAGQEYHDARIKKAFEPYTRNIIRQGSSVKEWYDVSPDEAIAKILAIPEFADAVVRRDVTPSLPEKQLDYEDWRDRGRNECRWRAFLFQVFDLPEKTHHGHVGRLKIAAGSLYDTAYRYNFTYNPFPVLLIGGFETDQPIPENNQRIINGWQHAVNALGKGTKTQPMGWLSPGVAPTDVRDVLAEFDCRPFSLGRPKPEDARPKDPSLSATPIGCAYPLERILDAFHPATS